jgi:hypothetical protein
VKRLILAVILALSVPTICVEADQESAVRKYNQLRNLRYERHSFYVRKDHC